jgi:HSP20 family molecular chaperone IbpA
MADTTLGTEAPPVNVYEGNGELTVATPIPGAHPQHTEVAVTPEEIRIDARCKYPQESQHYHRHEWRVGAWNTLVPLPKRIDPERARATLSLGVLVIMAPIDPDAIGEALVAVEQPAGH